MQAKRVCLHWASAAATGKRCFSGKGLPRSLWDESESCLLGKEWCLSTAFIPYRQLWPHSVVVPSSFL